MIIEYNSFHKNSGVLRKPTVGVQKHLTPLKNVRSTSERSDSAKTYSTIEQGINQKTKTLIIARMNPYGSRMVDM